MNKMIKLKKILNEAKFDQSFNIRMLKNIKFNPGPWDFVDKEMKRKPFGIAFKDLSQSKPIVDKAVDAASKKHPAVADMTIAPGKDEYGNYRIEIRNGNYAGLTYIFQALDKAYGKYGSAMGWHI